MDTFVVLPVAFAVVVIAAVAVVAAAVSEWTFVRILGIENNSDHSFHAFIIVE
jgi:hypothetical protein